MKYLYFIATIKFITLIGISVILGFLLCGAYFHISYFEFTSQFIFGLSMLGLVVIALLCGGIIATLREY